MTAASVTSPAGTSPAGTTPRPFRLGSCLFTVVEPHAGREREYHRWYERDHFYSGMMAGPHVFAGRRWVAPRRLKDLPGALGRGSFLATYWIEEGRHDAFMPWAMDAVVRLGKEGRMYPHRDHVHTAFYDFVDWEGRDPDGVPVDLALDHPFAGVIGVLGGDPPPVGGPVALRASFSPLKTPTFDVAPETLHVLFVEADPGEAWEAIPAGDGVVWRAGFIPTVPGTDRYLDEL